jgi:hypothetical protein
MSYTDYLNRQKINSPRVIDTQMRLPDASSFTWRTKMLATAVRRPTDHVINNVQDPNPAPTLNSKKPICYPGTGFGGRVPDASTYTMGLGSLSLHNDVFSGGRIRTVTVNAHGDCLASTPASQIVSELGGNADGDVAGLNMGYITRAPYGPALCNTRFNPLSESQFVDTHPDVKTKKMGVLPIGSRTGPDGMYTNYGSQGTITGTLTTNTTGNVKDAQGRVIQPDNRPYNTYSARPYNAQKAAFITSPSGPQVGGGYSNGSRAPKAGGAVPRVSRMITHRGWANPTRIAYPAQRVPPRAAPAQLKINDPNHYKT